MKKEDWKIEDCKVMDIIETNHGFFMVVEKYNGRLDIVSRHMADTSSNYPNFTINKVYREPHINGMGFYHYLFKRSSFKEVVEDWKCIYQRVPVKEVTMADIEAKFGCKVQVVK